MKKDLKVQNKNLYQKMGVSFPFFIWPQIAQVPLFHFL